MKYKSLCGKHSAVPKSVSRYSDHPQLHVLRVFRLPWYSKKGGSPFFRATKIRSLGCSTIAETARGIYTFVCLDYNPGRRVRNAEIWHLFREDQGVQMCHDFLDRSRQVSELTVIHGASLHVCQWTWSSREPSDQLVYLSCTLESEPRYRGDGQLCYSLQAW